MLYIKLVVVLIPLCASASIPDIQPPGLPTDPAVLARYIILKSDWLSIATISSQKTIAGYPFVTLKAMSDGPKTNSTGVPYLYMSELAVTSMDLEADDRVTVMVSLAQSDYCRTLHINPQDHRCPKVFITGKYVKLVKGSPEYEFGKKALFDKHPDMLFWPEDHGFFVAKIDPILIEIFAGFGGIKEIKKEDYFSADISSFRNS